MTKTALQSFLLLLVCMGLAGCGAGKWDVLQEKTTELSWPSPPNQPYVEYVGAFRSFVQVGKSLQSLLFGKDQKGQLGKPVAIAVGGDGRMAIADMAQKGVHFYTPSQQAYQFISKANTTAFVSPVSVTFAGEFLAVSDSALNKVFFFDSSGNYSHEISQAGAQPLGRPTGLAYDSGLERLYVVDTLANKVHIYSANGKYQKSIGERGVLQGQFNMPTHATVSGDGSLYVVDAMNFRVQVFNSHGDFVTMFGHHGDGSGDFAMPKGVGVDRQGVVFIAEHLFDVLQLFDEKGNYLMRIGQKGVAGGEFWMPSGVFISRDNRLFVCDTYNQRIQIFKILGKNPGRKQ